MARRVLILSAGSGPSNNLIRSLKTGDPSLSVVGCHADRFVLKKSVAERNYPVPVTQRALPGALRHIIKAEGIDLIIANSETDVTTLSQLRERLQCRVFLPRKAVIARCQDKYKLTTFLRRRAIATPQTYPITDLEEIEGLFTRFAGFSQLWCRIRKGTGSVGAIPVKSPDQARGWIKYWEEMRRIPPGSFTLSEYLPGRDFTVQCLLKDGRLIMVKMHERLEYHVVGGVPSGVSSSAALAKMVFEPSLLQVSLKAILALDPRASGVFFVDLKENANGEACITEINAGRFANVPTIHDLAGKDNMTITYVRVALGESVETREPSGYTENYYVLRSIDTLPAIVCGSKLFQDSDWSRGAGRPD